MHSKAITKYLDTYGEPETSIVHHIRPTRHNKYVLVIPAFDEEPSFVDRLSLHNDAIHLLLVLIVNQPDNTPSNSKNIFLINHLLTNAHEHKNHKHLHSLKYKDLDIILVDKTQAKNQIPRSKGVGLARKIGCDIASLLIFESSVICPLIYSSDADAHLPSNYFLNSAATCQNSDQLSGIVFNFEHINDGSKTAYATQLYERCIKYYAQQVKNAGSKYGFCSLGSCLAIHFEKYCLVRGFPQKPAGEDFYLLNKLAKIGRIERMKDISVLIDSRVSERVPFGTGPAVLKMLSQLERQESPSYYNPKIFDDLRGWLALSSQFIIDTPSAIINCKEKYYSYLEYHLLPKDQPITKGLIDIGIYTFFKHAVKQCKTHNATQQHLDNWLDGFKTLKLIHWLEKNHYEAVSLYIIFENISID